MSYHIPFHIQVEIIKRLPVKSLLQFRSVSKPWKHLIHSSDFIAGYSPIQQERLLIWYEDPRHRGENYVSFVNDGTFAQEFAPPTVKLHKDPLVVGSSHGLVCLYGAYRDHFESDTAILWNPWIRKSVGVAVHGVEIYENTFLGFGVCPITCDPTIVRFTYYYKNGRASVPWMVEVFKLSEGIWRIPCRNLPNDLIQVSWSQVVIDKFIYWFAADGTPSDGFGAKKMIMSFDMTSEEFGVIDLPDSLAHQPYSYFTISKVRDTLAVFEQSINNMGELVCDVWMMNRNSFTKLFTIHEPYESTNILGFTNGGGLIMDTNDDYKEPGALVVYEPSLKHFNGTGIYGKHRSFFAGYYIKTILLLDKSDCKIYAKRDDDDGALIDDNMDLTTDGFWCWQARCKNE